MNNKILCVVLGGLIGAGATYGLVHGLQHVKPQVAEKPYSGAPKTLTYKDIINPPKGEYGKDVQRQVADVHTQIYKAFEKEVAALPATTAMFKLNPYGTAPLSALAGVKTNVPTTIEVIVHGDEGDRPISHKFNTLQTEHIIPVLGLLPDNANTVLLVSYNKDGKHLKTYELTIQTPSVEHQVVTPEVIKAKARNTHGKLYFITPSEGKGMGKQTPRTAGYDERGRVRWVFAPEKGATVLMKPWKDGKWLTFMPNKLANERGGSTKYFMAFDLTGRIHNVWYGHNRLHHDFKILENGNVTIATDTEQSIEDVAITVKLEEGNPNLEIVETLYLNKHIRPRPIILDAQAGFLPFYDWFHMNGIDENPEKDYRVYSGRNQSAVVAMNDDNTLRWIMADPEAWPPEMHHYLLKAKGENFEWPWGQHSPVFRDAKHMLLFDNGNFRAIDRHKALKAHENYSRIVEYKINDDNTVEQTWSFGKDRGYHLYAPYVGGVDFIPETETVVGVFGGVLQNRLGNPSDIVAGNFKNKAHVIEVTHTTPPKVLTELVFKNNDLTTDTGYMIYRGSVCGVYCAYGE